MMISPSHECSMQVLSAFPGHPLPSGPEAAAYHPSNLSGKSRSQCSVSLSEDWSAVRLVWAKFTQADADVPGSS